ncbi:hypothetical protein [Peredibacter starrii]|uniref:Secreted protein n=1 Tax=Peredibacter starrii TaxID=28202 RepID=A0AAX4HUN3_9BACT|nr:hypothetical protein [Peredibacter starrii]WPU66967.1 hypothetical protein SOO65_09410 [Peredibacter starrii]
MKPMFILFIMLAALTSSISLSFAQDSGYINEDEMLSEEGTPSEYTFPMNESEMEKADLERQEEIISPDAANTDWNMDDVAPETDF